MISSLVLAVSLIQGGQAQQPFNCAALVGKMLQRYTDAKTLSGTVKWTQKAADKQITMDQALQFERPDKLYILQTRERPEPATKTVVADGKVFVYDVPMTLDVSEKRLFEVQSLNGRTKPIAEVYAAAALSLLDRSVPIDIAIGRREDLKAVRNQWMTLEDKGPLQFDSVAARRIQGDWRELLGDPAVGRFEMIISDEGDLLEYAVAQKVVFTAPNGQQLPPQEVLTTYIVKFKINGPVDPKLFTPR